MTLSSHFIFLHHQQASRAALVKALLLRQCQKVFASTFSFVTIDFTQPSAKTTFRLTIATAIPGTLKFYSAIDQFVDLD
jgi:hypothetical protein